MTATKEDLIAALTPLMDKLAEMDPSSAKVQQSLRTEMPLDSEQIVRIRRMVREGIEAGWLAHRENDGIRFGRLVKPSHPGELSVDVVHMHKPGPAHRHPNGEFDLCFAVEGSPKFDGNPEGWVVYGKDSWHVPTVTDGVMDILYFLPNGAIQFD